MALAAGFVIAQETPKYDPDESLRQAKEKVAKTIRERDAKKLQQAEYLSDWLKKIPKETAEVEKNELAQQKQKESLDNACVIVAIIITGKLTELKADSSGNICIKLTCDDKLSDGNRIVASGEIEKTEIPAGADKWEEGDRISVVATTIDLPYEPGSTNPKEIDFGRVILAKAGNIKRSPTTTQAAHAIGSK